MASDVSVPNSFTNGTTADAPEVNANFASIVTWINTNAQHVDGSKAFTGTPSGPAADPTTANQLTRKAYVDAKVWATANYADESVTNAKLAHMATATLKGRLTAGTGDPEDLPAASVEGMLSLSGAVMSGKLNAATIVANGITETMLAPGCVSTDKILDNTIVNDDLSLNLVASNVKGTALYNLCGRVLHGTTQSIPDDTETIMLFNTEHYDYAGMHSTSTDTGNILMPSAGVVHFDTMVPFASDIDGYRHVRIERYNSGGVFQDVVAECLVEAGDNVWPVTVTCGGDALVAANDIIQVRVRHTAGAALSTVVNAVTGPRLSWHYVRLS